MAGRQNGLRGSRSSILGRKVAVRGGGVGSNPATNASQTAHSMATATIFGRYDR